MLTMIINVTQFPSIAPRQCCTTRPCTFERWQERLGRLGVREECWEAAHSILPACLTSGDSKATTTTLLLAVMQRWGGPLGALLPWGDELLDLHVPSKGNCCSAEGPSRELATCSCRVFFNGFIMVLLKWCTGCIHNHGF